MANKKSKKSKKSAPKKSAAKKIVAKKSVAKKAVAKKSLVKKPVAKKTVAKKTIAKKSAVKPRTAQVVRSVTKPVKLADYTKAFTPLADRLVVRVVENEKVTAGGIIIPDSAQGALGHLKGQVLAVGIGAKNKKGQTRPLDVKLGDYVLFAEYAGLKVEFNSEELHIVKESDVMGIVQK